MSKPIQCCLGVTVLTLFTLASASQAGTALSERIYFVQQDGRHALVYTTSRTDLDEYNLWFKKEPGSLEEESLEEFLYLFPKSGEWNSDAKPGYRVLKLPSGNFASLEWTDLEKNGRLQVDDHGVHRFRNWDGETRTQDGYYGLWNSPGNFAQVAYSWVFPDNFEPVSHTANRKGEWVQRHNTITYYGTEVNKLSFDIQYRPATGDTYDDLLGLEGEGVDVEQEAGGVKVTLEETLLFPTGVARISDAGEAVLDRLAEKLKTRSSLHVVIAGHTDNVPISGSLAAKYPSNWELASARSINIIHYLVSQGVAESRFESHSFSFMQPIESNESAGGRGKNRRIEVFLSEMAADSEIGTGSETETPADLVQEVTIAAKES
jgi:flagellar motor protein MotB